MRDEVIDRLWNTIATEGWDEPKLRAERFQRIGSSNVPALWGLRAAMQLANQIGMERIERRHRQIGGLHFERDGAARSGIVDFAGCGAALRDRGGERAADSDHGARKLDVEEQEDSHSRRSAFEDPAFDAVLFAAEGCGPVPGGVRRIPANKESA